MIDMARFAAASDATWPGLERRALDGWVMRFSGEGAGSRANSAWAAGPLDRPVGDAIAAVEAACRAAGRPPCFQLWPRDGALDARLEALGWVGYDRSTIVARALEPAEAVADAWPVPADGVGVVAVNTAVEAVRRLWAEGGIGPQRRAVFARARGPRAVVLARRGQALAGVAGLGIDGEVAVTQALWVTPRHRGHGVARTLMGALAAEAASAGARVMAHAVVETNGPARALYDRLGFRAIGAYHYRRAPA